MLNNRWKRRIALTVLIIAFMGLFLRYAPWLFGSQPIELVHTSGVSNLPPPEGAKSFSINHGKAMYFDEPVPSEVPWKTSIVVIYFVFIFVGVWMVKMKFGAEKDAA